MRKWMCFGTLLMGCGTSIDRTEKTEDSGVSEDDEGGWGSGSTSGGGGGGDEGDDDDDGPAVLENPSVQYASAVCLDGTAAFWQLELVASDPQGINTLSGTATCEVYPVGVTEGTPTHTVSMECDGTGRCGQNYDGGDEGVLCSDATNWDFHFMIMDEDGYLSSVEVVTGSVE